MVSWAIIIIFIIVALVVIKLSNINKVFVIILLLLALFLYLSIVFIDNSNDLNFDSVDGTVNTGKVYFGWLGNGFSNLKVIVGNAIKMDWTSTNRSFLNESDEKPERKVKVVKP